MRRLAREDFNLTSKPKVINLTAENIYMIFFLCIIFPRHFSDDVSKAFRHGNVDYLEKPEHMSSMAVPGTLSYNRECDMYMYKKDNN